MLKPNVKSKQYLIDSCSMGWWMTYGDCVLESLYIVEHSTGRSSPKQRANIYTAQTDLQAARVQMNFKDHNFIKFGTEGSMLWNILLPPSSGYQAFVW